MNQQARKNAYLAIQIDGATATAVEDIEALRKQHELFAAAWLISALIITVLWVSVYTSLYKWQEWELMLSCLIALIVGFLLFKGLGHLRKYLIKTRLLSEFKNAVELISNAISSETAANLAAAIKSVRCKSNTLLESWISVRESKLRKIVDLLYKEELHSRLKNEVKQFERQYLEQAKTLRFGHPLYQAYFALESAELHLQKRRAELDAEWKRAYEKFSWWNKLKYGSDPDFRELDEQIRSLNLSQRVLLKTHSDDFERVKSYYSNIAKLAFERVTHAAVKVEKFIQQSKFEDNAGADLMKKGFWLASMSVPVSLWADVTQAGDVYDVLRSVNSNYIGMSDAEIWWETLFLPSDSLAGLVSLTKGAYLESLVAADSGGRLYEHFNHPDTDIVIDGVAFQIKATDSVSYISTVEDGVPIIATSEVAGITDAIDSGYTNEDLHETVTLALGGSIIDVGDTAVDAILAGVGGLGALATLAGINHAVTKYDKGGDPVEAMFEGAGIAIEGTARAAVNTMEIGYKALNSKPSRFVGRMLVKGFVKLDNKLMGTDSRTKM